MSYKNRFFLTFFIATGDTWAIIPSIYKSAVFSVNKLIWHFMLNSGRGGSIGKRDQMDGQSFLLERYFLSSDFFIFNRKDRLERLII